MLDLIDFTSCDEVRSTLGLSSVELPDSTVGLPLYSIALEVALDDITMVDGAHNPIKTYFLTQEDGSIYNLVRLFSTYLVAMEIATALSMMAPKQISDSKASLVRFSPEATWQDVEEKIASKVASLKGMLEVAGATTTSSMTLMAVVTPSVDPITGA